MSYELCPECGSRIVEEVLTSDPPILQKRCINCESTWRKKARFTGVITFKPDETWVKLKEEI